MFALTQPIETERLLLRQFAEEDLDWLVALHANPAVNRYLETGARERDELRVKFERTALRGAGDALNVAAVLRGSGELVGDMSLFWRSEEHRQGEVGWILDPAHGGRGYATEAARALLRVGFEEIDLHRICARLEVRNTASARVAERLGMRREAHLRENEMLKGEWVDEVVYAVLAREWRDAAAADPAPPRSQRTRPPRS